MKPYFEDIDSGITIYHGDCREILPTFPDKSFDLVLTDPPYGIDFQSARRIERKRKAKIQNDCEPFVDWIRLIQTVEAVITFCRWDVEDVFRDELARFFEVRSEIIWDKVVHGMGNLKGSFAPQHENALFAAHNGFRFKTERPKSIIREQRVPPEKMTHPNEKPVGLLQKLMKPFTGASILDPFMGSGTTLVAAKQLGRKAVGIEIEEKYCKIAVKRLAQMELFRTDLT